MKNNGLYRLIKEIRISDIAFVSAICFFVAICYRLFYRMCIDYKGRYSSDFGYYIEYAQTEGVVKNRLLSWLFGLMDKNGIGLNVMVGYLAFVIALTVIANYTYLKFFLEKSGNSKTVTQLASILIPFMGPIYIPVFHEYFYRWSFQTYAWHSPTEQSMILYSIPTMLCFIKMYEESEDRVSAKWWLLTASTGFISTFAKPAFIIDLIVAMVIMFLVDLLVFSEEPLGDRFKKRVAMGTSLIPSGLYILTVMNDNFGTSSGEGSGSIALKLTHVLEYNNLFAAIVCGLAFPIIVWSVNYKLIYEKRYKTVILVFVTGIFQWMLFVEQGERATHGNFTWGRQVGCYFFFMTSVSTAINNYHNKEFMQEKPLMRKVYFGALLMLLALHVSSQLRYFYLICIGQGYLL